MILLLKLAVSFMAGEFSFRSHSGNGRRTVLNATINQLLACSQTSKLMSSKGESANSTKSTRKRRVVRKKTTSTASSTSRVKRLQATPTEMHGMLGDGETIRECIYMCVCVCVCVCVCFLQFERLRLQRKTFKSHLLVAMRRLLN